MVPLLGSEPLITGGIQVVRLDDSFSIKNSCTGWDFICLPKVKSAELDSGRQINN